MVNTTKKQKDAACDVTSKHTKHSVLNIFLPQIPRLGWQEWNLVRSYALVEHPPRGEVYCAVVKSGYLRQWRLPANSIRSGRSRRPSLINKVFLLLEHRRIFRTTLETVVVENPRRKAAPHSNSRDNILMFDASINWSRRAESARFHSRVPIKVSAVFIGTLVCFEGVYETHTSHTESSRVKPNAICHVFQTVFHRTTHPSVFTETGRG